MASSEVVRRRVSGANGVELAVHQHGDPRAPTVVCVHGYPDDHHVWDGVVALLSAKYHVVAYDVRGAGDSDKPAARSAYLLDVLTADLVAVLDAVTPDAPAHLLAHDWGSIQAWHAVTEPALRPRIASYTSISGPCLDHAGHWLRSKLRPSPRALRELLTQLAFSGYIGFLHLAPLPELAWRSGLGQRVLRLLERNTERRPHALPDLLNGLNLYRANMLHRFARPQQRHTEVPVQVLAPARDPFVGAPVQTEIGRWVPDLRVRRIVAGHWAPSSHPGVVARCTDELIEHVRGMPETRALRRARGGRTGDFADQLVVITGAGGGIGRATALAFAEQGAEIVAADLDAEAARRTAEQVGGSAYPLDVSDGEAFAAFAKQVRAEHGVPDVVVNNAGIGMAGPFTETSVADWERVIEVNLWGVIHGSRLFVEQLRERGEGGTLVNIASAAAYTTSRSYPAYATTKAAVLTLTESLRAELAADGIGVTAICPGLVNTGITATTRFVGLDAEQERDRQRSTTALYRRRNFSPERTAREILRAVRRNTAVAPVTPEAKVTLALSRLTPGLLRAAARFDLSPR